MASFLYERRNDVSRSKQIIGLFLIIVSILGLVFWEKWGKNEFLYDDALVLRENVERGTLISENMLTVKKMNIEENYIPYEAMEKVIGKQATGFIHKGVPLFEEYVQDPNLSPNEKRETYMLAVPQEWILSKPETLSKGDKVFFFSDGKLLTAAFVSNIFNQDTVEVVTNKEQTEKISKQISMGKKLVLAYQ